MVATTSRIKRVVLVQPASAGGNFEYMAIPRQGMLFLSTALGQWEDGPFLYEREIWFEDRSGLMDPDKDLENVDVLLVTALINEAPRAYQLARLAKMYHPELVTIGGGPQMSPLPEEAFALGNFDAIVQREGEDIVAQLCDVMLTHQAGTREAYLENIPGISFRRDGQVIQTRRRGLVDPAFAELPDYRSIKDLSPDHPMPGGVLETVRGCTENCTYCQVIQQFLGYRMIPRETEIKRLQQLQELASDGLLHTSRTGRFNVFISDDLHTPPLRAVKFRNERLERLKNWKGHTDNMYMICQARAEIGQDPELANAMTEANIKMLYLGVESNNAENLLAVNKRQEPGQMEQDLCTLNDMDFSVVAMTIIGLPFDREEDIMNLAEWVTQHSRYQTANLLTPLPATSNWTDLQPLNEHGELLQEGEIRPYHLYTGRQFVHYDKRWTMQESRELFDQYSAKLTSIDDLYGRIFRILRSYKLRVATSGNELGDSISSRIAEASQNLQNWADPVSVAGKEFGQNISQRVDELAETLRNMSQPLSNARRDLADSINTKVNELTDTLKSMSDPVSVGSKDLADNVSVRITEIYDMINSVLVESSSRRRTAKE